jgi:sugar/nucleoside kinase (ribokinase family)
MISILHISAPTHLYQILQNYQKSPANSVEKVIDTSWAGDTFTGGILSSYFLGKDLEVAVKDGHEIAAKIIQKIGCNFDEE